MTVHQRIRPACPEAVPVAFLVRSLANELRLARTSVVEERAVIIDAHCDTGADGLADLDTMDAETRPHLACIDAQIARIDALLLDAGRAA
jgi:hypothetical protein